MDLDIRHFLAKAKANRDPGALQSAYLLIKVLSENSGQTPRIDSELFVLCAETALQLGCVEISEACLKIYFFGNPPTNHVTCRAFLCQGQLKSPPATGSLEDFKEAVMYFLKAIEIAKKEPRYHFIIFNASVLYFQTVRPLLKPGRCLDLVPSLKQMVQSLEEVAEQDYSWRAELMIHLVKSLVDSGEVEEASNVAKVAEDFIKTHTTHLYPKLYTLLVQYKLSEDDVLLETSTQCTTLAVIYKMQALKKRWFGINVKMMTKEDFGKLEEIFYLLVDCPKATATPVNSIHLQNPTHILWSDRVAFLLELALLSLQVKHQEVAVDCLKELKSAREATIDQRIIMECVSCEINLLKKEANMKVYSKSSVEAHLKEIDKLDQWLQTAVKEGSPRAVQAVCVTQWSSCLPLLQCNLRKRIKTSLLKIAQALEDMQSVLLEVRCQVHSELAVIEEEEGCLEASSTHLQKAMLLDNGTQRERLSSAYQLLQLRRILYETPTRPEDKAALLIQQARDMLPQSYTDSHPILVSVGLLLAPEDFQIVLDADNTSKRSLGNEPVVQLATKAQHHYTCVQKVGGHLARQSEDKDNTERAKLWATLAQTARKQEVWDVCRAACRFCLLYDDGRWKIDKCKSSKEESVPECLQSCSRRQTCVHMSRLLAEICFINAEATIQKLLAEGLKLNSSAVPPQERGEDFFEEDPHWVIYRDWIQALSDYATSNFLRAGEIGAEIGEQWLVANASIYLWNYNNHLVAAGEYRLLLPTFQSIVELLQTTEDYGNPTVCALLCDAVARGLIQPLSERTSAEPAPAGARGKNRTEKGKEKAASVHGASLDSAAMQDVHKALELCEFALCIFSGHSTAETVPLAAGKRVLTTWVQIKRLLQQQIDSKVDILKDKCGNEESSAITRVLVGVEMILCNRNLKHMEFSVPSISSLVCVASECSWSDAVVELEVWCQLAAFCYHVKDYSLVLQCTQTALQLEEAAVKSLNTVPCVLFEQTAVNEMLSIVACLRGLSLSYESSGDLGIYREALKALLSSVSFAEKADNQELCANAAGHFWNTCLPLTQIPQERRQLKEHLEMILTAFDHTSKHKNKQSDVKRLMTLRSFPYGSYKHGATNVDKDLTLKAAIYDLLQHIYIEEADFDGALQLLEKAIRDLSCTRHHLPLLKDRILLKARQGESIELDMQKLQEGGGGGEFCSFVWHQATLSAGSINQQLNCYQKAITSLTSTETLWSKVSILLEFGGWLYCHNFPKEDAQQQVQWATDILLHLEPADTKKTDKYESLLGVHGSFIQSLSDLKEVCYLDHLVQAHTLLAVMSDKTSHEHQLNLLRAYIFVLLIWQGSMAVACEVSGEAAKSQSPHSPFSVGSKRGKDKSKEKRGKDPTPAEERHKAAVLDQTLPTNPQDWARFVCPDQARQIFRTNTNPCCINEHSIRKKTQSLFYLTILEKELNLLSLNHLTLPILHLAETIAHDILDWRSLSDLYRLRIVRTCIHLGLDSYSPYQEKLLRLSGIQEEQMECHKALVLSQKRRSLHTVYNEKADLSEQAASWRPSKDVSVQDIWLDKAEVCLSLGLFQPANQLLAEAHMVATELGDKKAITKCLLSLATLACEEQNYAQALILLDRAQTLGGNAEFWYQLTLIKVTAVVGQRDRDLQSKLDHIIKHGCEALKLLQGQQVNRVPELTSLIASLNQRGAVERVNAIACAETLSTEDVQRLTDACATLRECASCFTKLSCREQAVEAHQDCSYVLRLLVTHSTDREKKQRFLLDGLSQMQLAVTLQECVVLNAQSLLPPQESPDLSLAATRRLMCLRLCLAKLGLDILEEHCAAETRQAVTHRKKTSDEIALEEFIRSTPEPNSTEQEWVSVVRTSGQMALSQLAAVSFQSLDNMEIRARCLSLMGKYLRLLAVQEDPVYVSSLWDGNKQEAWSDAKSFPTAEQTSEKDSDSSRNKPGIIPARSAELQRRLKAQQLLTEASKALSEAINLCLQHNLSSTILTDASLNMLECHGHSDPAAAGQFLALFQSCCAVTMVAEVLSLACADTSVSQISALHSFQRKCLLSQEERPSSLRKGAEEFLNSLSKAFSFLTICSNHLNILSEIPPNLKILLLQHSKDGSELYGGFYESIKAPENLKGKTTQVTVAGTVTCSRVAKVSVCPQALLTLREQIRLFGHETRQSLLKEDSVEAWLEASVEHQKTAGETKLALHFREIVKNLEDYLSPLLSQFDLSCLRLKTASLPVYEMTKSKNKEEKCSPDKVEQSDYVVLLADRKLLELPLESLSVLQGLSSVSRDFSLQFFCSRLSREEPQKVESDNKKETRGGRGTKGKVDQSQTIKGLSANPIVPPHTFPVDTLNFKYIVDPYNTGQSGPNTLGEIMKTFLETHSQHVASLWEGFVGSKERPSLPEIEQILSRCSAFIYLGMDPFLANIPPAKLAALNLSECRMALLFDHIQNKGHDLHQSNLERQKSEERLALQNPLETALLLSLSGVGCIVLNQWHGSFLQSAHNMAAVLDNIMGIRQTSGETVQALRRGDNPDLSHHRVTGTHDQELLDDSKEDEVQYKTALRPPAFNCILYGLPNLIAT